MLSITLRPLDHHNYPDPSLPPGRFPLPRQAELRRWVSRSHGGAMGRGTRRTASRLQPRALPRTHVVASSMSLLATTDVTRR